MKVVYVLDEVPNAGWVEVVFEHVSRLKKRGLEAFLVANGWNHQYERRYGVQVKEMAFLETLTDQDTLISCHWTQVSELERYPGRKIQFVQMHEARNYENVEIKENILRARQRSGWEIMVPSKYLGEWIARDHTVVPNGVNERFLNQDWLDREIDVLIVAEDVSNNNLPYTFNIAEASISQKTVWVGRETREIAGISRITNPSQEELSALYAKSKCLLRLLHSEGFGIPILEAFATGCIVVTWPSGGNDFCLDKQNCFIGPGFQNKIAAIDAILSDTYPHLFEEIRKNARATAEAFSWDHCIDILVPYLTSRSE